MKQFIDLLKNSEYCVVFTGAGVSTLAGIKDFRGKNGLYNTAGADAEKIFDIDYFRKDPSFYYRAAKNFIYNLEDKVPAIVHTELARLEKMGIVKAVITQNIDLLHQKAGSKKVIEVHGSPEIHRCRKCGKIFHFNEIVPVVQKDEVPKCDRCGGIIKPDITFFGESLPPMAVDEAIYEASKADLMVILGSTLVVQPAASFPLYALRNGGKLVIVNNMETPLDYLAVQRYDDLETVFNYISENLK
ncbi:MAG: NAD-dependent deacetylase [Spirochaetia bacterium]|nr:NAD-dependent deacetylase [Spirochaetia bacterium]